MNSDGKSFDTMALIYNDVRPGYPDEVYQAIHRVKRFSDDSMILEIGAGNGVATREIWRHWQPKIIALEPGLNLLAIAQRAFADNPKIAFVNTEFENYTHTPRAFDGIFAATAFHWLNPKSKYQQCSDLLKDDGVFVLYWNNYGIGEPHLAQKIHALYQKYGLPGSDKSREQVLFEKAQERQLEIEQSELFTICANQFIYKDYPYPTEKYIGLLKTFPNHAKEKFPQVDQMFEEIKQIGDANHDCITVNVVVDLKIARKKMPKQVFYT